MPPISGKTGSVTYAAGYTTNVHDWEADDSTEILDTTPFSPPGDYRTKIVGLHDWKVTYSCWIDDTMPLPKSGTTGAATFQATAGRTWSGTIYVQNVHLAVAADGSKREATIGAEGTGELNAA